MAGAATLTGAIAACWELGRGGTLAGDTARIASVAGAVALGALWWWGLRPGVGGGPISWRLLLVAAALVRAPLLLAEPGWSDDLYRYRWEGRAQWAGVNPYRVAPAERPDLDHDGLLAQVNHPELPAIYPPAAQLLFAAAAGGGADGSSAGSKACLVAVELALIGLLARRGRPRRARGDAGCGEVATWLAFHPILLLEVAGNGHLDILVAAAMGAFFLAWRRRRWGGAGALLALATGLKLLPAVLLPLAAVAVARRGGLRRALWCGAAFALVLAALYAPYLAWEGDGTRPGAATGSLAIYALKWQRHAPLFPLVERALAATGAPERWQAEARVAHHVGRPATWRAWGFHREARASQQVAKRALALAGAVVFCGVAWRVARRGGSLEAAAMTLFGAVVLMSPVVYPWYLLLLLPMLAARAGSAWQWAALAAPLLYLEEVAWIAAGATEPAVSAGQVAIRVVVWGPTLALLVAEAVRRGRRGAVDLNHAARRVAATRP